MDGILIVNKDFGCTSRDVVNETCKILNTKKIGHTGTLDPIATGVLVLCVGQATKLVEIISSLDKEYIAEVTLGTLTDTLDNTGNILKEEKVKITKEKIIDTLNNMIGVYDQEVPIYSAIKVKGKKLYEYARNNEEITLPKRKVTIKELELISDVKYVNDKTIFSIRCSVSKGTYIRSLIRDLALNLNTIGIMSKLNRIKQGKFNIDDSYTLSDIKNGDYKLIPMLDILDNIKQVNVDDEFEIKLKNGLILNNIYGEDVVLFKNNNRLISIYKTYGKDESKIKPWKTFKN
ncbi:MAG: tRNA pseudouridine(55) synthase TruB [Bacilli bacterium]|nr:tRNA pseudouridine(55) synthase TruB [Bacilli bacterium]